MKITPSAKSAALTLLGVLVCSHSAYSALVLDWQATGNNSNFTGSPATASIVFSSITTNSATKTTDGIGGFGTAFTIADFGGTGSLGIDFTAGNAFVFSTWSFSSIAGTGAGATVLSSNNTNGLGVHTDADGTTVNAMRGINATELLQFSIDTTGFNDGGNQLQVRVTVETGDITLFKQTGANTGASLGAIVANTTSAWFDVDGLQTFALAKGTGNNNTQSRLATLEFQVIPEPSSLALIGAGLALSLLRRRRA
jgi:hypothetical protein